MKIEMQLYRPIFVGANYLIFTALVQVHTCVFHTLTFVFSLAKGNSRAPRPLSMLLAKCVPRPSGSLGYVDGLINYVRELAMQARSRERARVKVRG